MKTSVWIKNDNQHGEGILVQEETYQPGASMPVKQRQSIVGQYDRKEFFLHGSKRLILTMVPEE